MGGVQRRGLRGCELFGDSLPVLAKFDTASAFLTDVVNTPAVEARRQSLVSLVGMGSAFLGEPAGKTGTRKARGRLVDLNEAFEELR